MLVASVGAGCPGPVLCSRQGLRDQSPGGLHQAGGLSEGFLQIFIARPRQGRDPACLPDATFGFVVLAINLKK